MSNKRSIYYSLIKSVWTNGLELWGSTKIEFQSNPIPSVTEQRLLGEIKEKKYTEWSGTTFILHTSLRGTYWGLTQKDTVRWQGLYKTRPDTSLNIAAASQ